MGALILLRILYFSLCVFILIGCATPPERKGPPTLLYLSDFGIKDSSVAVSKGAMLSIAPQLRIIDITHDVTPHSIREGARFLARTAKYYPAGTVFVGVVDPGVGSARKAIVAKSGRGHYFVVPDNGLITLVDRNDGIVEVREIRNPDWTLGRSISSTFHGRDIFAPVGAHIARGADWSGVGPKLQKWVKLDYPNFAINKKGLVGEVIAIEHPFGNLFTNITSEGFEKLGYDFGETIPVTIGKRKLKIPFHKTFSDVALNKELLYIDSRKNVGFALNQGNFANRFGIKATMPIFIPRKK